MKISKWVGVLAVLLLVASGFLPWVEIPARELTVTGLNTTGTNFGKPALMNVILSALAAVFFILPSIMAKRVNVFVCTLNFAWAIRNYILLSICRAGECPEKRIGLYLLLFFAVVMLIASLFPDVTIKADEDGMN